VSCWLDEEIGVGAGQPGGGEELEVRKGDGGDVVPGIAGGRVVLDRTAAVGGGVQASGCL